MNKVKNKKLTQSSRALRQNMTKEERHLWYDFLKVLPVTVHRQKVIGKYIVDFYVASCNIAIELDGSQHYDDESAIRDKERTSYLENMGVKVIRYSNTDINLNFQSVCEELWNLIVGE